MDEEAIARATRKLTGTDNIAEAAILSTCNRTEIYLYADDAGIAVESARGELDADDHWRQWNDMEAAEHLFRVASGLESQVLGEAQILRQVSDALDTAQGLGVVGPNLHSLFRSAISCARQARSGTALGRVKSSLGSEAVRAARQAVGNLEKKAVLLIGGGEVARLVADELAHVSLSALYVANRTASGAQDIAGSRGATAVSLEDVRRLIPGVDVVITATSAAQFVLTAEDVSPRDHPLHIFDLALPRDVDPSVSILPQVTVHDLDSLLPDGGLEGYWQGDVVAMEAVIAAEVHEFMTWNLTRRVAPVIASLRSHVEAVQRQEMKRVAPRLKDLTDRERAAVESLTSRLIDKMFHHLVVRLRLAAQTDPALVDAAEFFFLHGEGGLFEHAAQMEMRAQQEMKR